MNLFRPRLIHWIAALAFMVNVLAPAFLQAVSLAKDGHGFAMEICTVSGNKIEANVQTDEESGREIASQFCPYCVAATFITPLFNIGVLYRTPQTLALLPLLFYRSPKVSFVWIRPPSAAPPKQA